MKSTNLASIFLATAIVSGAQAAGSDDSTPPIPTETSTKCKRGEIWDTKTKNCAKVKASLYGDDILYEAARELAYAGQLDRAMGLLKLAGDQRDPRILNYKGFVNRKLGNMTEAMTYYRSAIAINPDYILARSYMGQGLISLGKHSEALEQLREIKARGGRDSWAYRSLKLAMAGNQSNY